MLAGVNGDDELIADPSGSQLAGGNGRDILIGSFGDDWLHGDRGGDVMRGRSGSDFYFPEGGDDVRDSGGNDVALASEGANKIRLGDGVDSVTSFWFENTIRTGRGHDVVSAASGSIYTGRGADSIEMSEGTQQFDPLTLDVHTGGGSDTITLNPQTLPSEFAADAGPGANDTFYNSFVGDASMTFELSLGPDGEFVQPFSGSLVGVENYVNTRSLAKELITGSAQPNEIELGLAAGNHAWGLEGDDLLTGPTDPGTFDGGDGFDRCTNASEQVNCEADPTRGGPAQPELALAR